MRIIIGFEHIRRLVGARSQIVVEVARALQARGHDILIICDTVTDPDLFNDLAICTRRDFQSGESHRLTLMRLWARRVIARQRPDVTLSFFPAIPGDILVPLFGWARTALARDSSIRDGAPHGKARIVKRLKLLERLAVESVARSDPDLRCVAALSRHMYDDLLAADPTLESRMELIPGCSPLCRHADIGDEAARIRNEIRSSLRMDAQDVMFLWEATVASPHGRRVLIDAFARLVDAYRAQQADTTAPCPRPILVMAGEGQWISHDLSILKGCEKYIRILGRTAEMPALLHACDVGVLPALHSTVGRFAWECLGYGKPIIASDVTAGMDRVETQSGSTAGRTVAAGNVDQLCEAMADMLNAEQRMVATAAARALVPMFEFEDFVSRLERLLQRIADDKIAAIPSHGGSPTHGMGASA
ncbi:MAG: glycosyltransferase [Planctomycetes bacterium]|nr:glycosyltransferase [Planctomycetota bacterium]NOG54456.1 glycosyltransferase family 4 protein [Planctomycetota bacterium]